MQMPFHSDRIKSFETAQRPVAALIRLGTVVELDRDLRNLIDLRASQINGCAFCIDMHWKEARAAGESEERLYSLESWRESPHYSERERAALELCEAATLITDGHVPDAVWDRARRFFDEPELIQLIVAIAAINAFNRLNISARMEPGQYQAGMLEAA